MFKPLIKTLPSLSGNMKIACKLDGYKNVKPNIYECFVNEASLVPLSHNLYDKNIKINLKNNSYEHDVKTFYNYYSDIFYSTNFVYSKVNIPIIDFTSQIDDNNKDFQYGCKRVSYLKSNGNQFAFYAPIYAENLEDLDNKTFRIKITFSKVNKVTKYIDIHISSKCDSVYDENYLIDYIEKYYSKIDSKVIYCSPSYKNMYYGVDLLRGGFARIEDNISSNLYNKYYTINDFDCIINNGFKRNSIMMRQTFNLAFYFNPEKLLDNYEKILYKDCVVYISGNWYDGDEKLDFYSFSDNYNLFKEKIYKMVDGEFRYYNSEKNIMNINYPAFNEASSENFKYINTVSKNYNRWKLKYSNDEIPYITNLNFAFSLNQDSLYTYKEYPQFYNSLYCTCYENDDEVYEINLLNGSKEYKNMLNEKHIASFFNVLTREDGDEESPYIDIFDPKYQGFWTDVNKYDNKVYHQGILYDFNQMYTDYNIKDKIDKFSIFVVPQFSYTLNSEYNKKYKTVKFLYNPNNTDAKKPDTIDYNFVNSNLAYIKNYVTLEIANNDNIENNNDEVLIGSFNNKLTEEYFFIHDSEIRQYDTNCYYDINDIKIKLYSEYEYDEESENNIDVHLLNDINDLIDGYKLIDVYWSNNIMSDLFEEIVDLYNTNEYSDKSIFRKSRFTNYDSIYTMSDKLYFSIYPSKSKYNLLENYKLIGTENKRINLYYKSKFINKTVINEYLNKLKSELNLDIDIDLNNIPEYYFSNGLFDRTDNLVYTDPLFIKQSYSERNYGEEYGNDFENTDVIYVDIYNLNRVLYEVYGNKYKDHVFTSKENCLAKFLNKEHINIYYEKTYKESENQSIQDNVNPLDNIYICIRSFTNIDINLGVENLNTISIHNNLCKLNDFGITNLRELNAFVDYNSFDGYFYFNNEWIKEILPNILEDDKDNPVFNHQYNIIKFDLVFKRKMYIMDDLLYDLIINNKENDNTYRDLYLYHIDNSLEYKYEMNYQIIDFKNNKDINLLSDNLSCEGSDNNILLVPYFNSVYEEGKPYTKIYNDYFLNNIYRMNKEDENQENEQKNGGRYRYNLPNIDFVYKSDIKNNTDKDIYTFVKTKEADFITNSQLNSQNDQINEILNIDTTYLTIYPNNLLSYSYNETNYGFYIINVPFDNTKNTLNIVNDRGNLINSIDIINGMNVASLNKYSYTYLGNIFKNILPYMNNFNIVKFVSDNISSITKPNIYKLYNRYKQYSNKENDKIVSYTIYNYDKKYKIELSRYFDEIVPYIPKAKNLSSYYLYYKNTDNVIENDLLNAHIGYIIYNKPITLNKHTKVSYFDYVIKDEQQEYKKVAKKDFKKFEFEPLEYKHFNDNKYFCLEEEIIHEFSGTYTYDNMVLLENDKEKAYNIFKKYMEIIINKSSNYSLDEDGFLFLYKKYGIKYLHTCVSANQYTIKIKYYLL